jgi:hypothetical protein
VFLYPIDTSMISAKVVLGLIPEGLEFMRDLDCKRSLIGVRHSHTINMKDLTTFFLHLYDIRSIAF